MTTPFDRKIFWIHWMGRAVGETTIEQLIQTIKTHSPNVKGVAIKSNDGHYWQGRYDNKPDMAINGQADILRWAKALARHGLQTYLWCVVRGNDVEEESRIIGLACRTAGVKAMLLDVEVGEGYFGGQTAETARRLITRVRNAAPNGFHLALNLDARGNHPRNIHIDEWLPYVDSLHPMVYHWHFSEGTRGPKTYIDEAFFNLAKYNKPIVPMLQTYEDPSSGTRVPESHVYEAGVYSFQKGAPGISYFRLGTAGPPEFNAISKIDPNNIPDSGGGTPGPTKRFLVSTLVLNVRSEPSTDARTLLPGEQLRQGEQIEAQVNSRTERVGFVWWQHRTGWSAERKLDNSEVFLVDMNTPLPPPPFIFERSPVGLDEMRWFYYYGNTVFAYRYGTQHNYNGYSQGLHGGLDYGHPGGIPIYAGVNGVFDYSGSERAFGPNRVDILIGDYRIIYGHVSRPVSLARGTRVNPNTVVGTMDYGAQHMHLEIRYQNEAYILNPLQFMTEAMRNALISKFPPEGIYDFYSSPRWQRWLTPLDQPTIIRGGPVIGPKA